MEAVVFPGGHPRHGKGEGRNAFALIARAATQKSGVSAAFL
jgi:hypothetical protein